MKRALAGAGMAAAVLWGLAGCGGGVGSAADASVKAPDAGGAAPSCLGAVAWYFDNAEGSVQKVGQKKANPWGLYDMEGNVAEWTGDCYHDTLAGAPSDGSAWTETTCTYYPVRGGSFGNTADALRLSARSGITSDAYAATVPGVRCVRAPGAADTGKVTLDWVTLQAGSFTMGCAGGDDECGSNEKPAHAVSGIASFQMTQYEVTERQYYTQTGLDPCKGCVTACDDCAASYISWDNAKAFCEAVGGRLPTEAEWEYAARAGGTTAYPSCE